MYWHLKKVEYDVMGIDINTVTLNRTVKAENDPKYDFVSSPQLQDKYGDGLPEPMVKFDRSAVEQILQPAYAVTLSVSGEFAQGIFEGYDAIRVIQKGKLEAKVRIDLFATGNLQVEVVLVEECIPNGFGVDTMTGMFTSHGLLWDVGRIEQGAQAGR